MKKIIKNKKIGMMAGVSALVAAGAIGTSTTLTSCHSYKGTTSESTRLIFNNVAEVEDWLTDKENFPSSYDKELSTDESDAQQAVVSKYINESLTSKDVAYIIASIYYQNTMGWTIPSNSYKIVPSASSSVTVNKPGQDPITYENSALEFEEVTLYGGLSFQVNVTKNSDNTFSIYTYGTWSRPESNEISYTPSTEEGQDANYTVSIYGGSTMPSLLNLKSAQFYYADDDNEGEQWGWSTILYLKDGNEEVFTEDYVEGFFAEEAHDESEGYWATLWFSFNLRKLIFPNITLPDYIA